MKKLVQIGKLVHDRCTEMFITGRGSLMFPKHEEHIRCKIGPVSFDISFPAVVEPFSRKVLKNVRGITQVQI